jgi:hypothetical protein
MYPLNTSTVGIGFLKKNLAHSLRLMYDINLQIAECLLVLIEERETSRRLGQKRGNLICHKR